MGSIAEGLNKAQCSEAGTLSITGRDAPVLAAGGPLEITPNTPPPSSDKSQKIRDTRSERYRLQGVARGLLWNEGVKAGLEYPANFHKTIKCAHVRLGDQVAVKQSTQHGKAFFSGLVVCGKPGCPVCAAKVQERRREEIAQAFDWAYTHDKKVVMVTFTFPHYAWQKLKDLLAGQAGAFTRLRKGKAWDKFKNRVGFDGLIRSLEVTHGESGWHPHTHEAWIVDKGANADYIRGLVSERWLRMCQKEGLVPKGKEAAFLDHAVDVMDNCRASDYFAKNDDSKNWGADRELAGGATKKGKKSGRHPFQLLSDYEDGDEQAGRLYLEYCEGIKGRAQIFWSRGLKDRVGINDKTDEELAAEQTDQAVDVVMLSKEDWACVVAHKAKAWVLDLAEIGGIKAVRRWLSAPEIPPTKALNKKRS